MFRIDTGRPILLYLKLDVHCSDVLRFRRNRIEIVLPMSTRPQSNLVYKWHLKTQTQNWNVSPTFLIVCNSSLYQVYCEWRRSPISDMACQIQSAIALHTTVLTEPIHYTHCTFYTFNTFQNSRWRKVRKTYQSAIYMVYLAEWESTRNSVGLTSAISEDPLVQHRTPFALFHDIIIWQVWRKPLLQRHSNLQICQLSVKYHCEKHCQGYLWNTTVKILMANVMNTDDKIDSDGKIWWQTLVTKCNKYWWHNMMSRCDKGPNMMTKCNKYWWQM